MPRDISLALGMRECLLRQGLYDALVAATLAGSPAVEGRRLKVLDVGAGRGELLQILTALNHEAVGLDPEPACVEAASRYARCELAGVEDVLGVFEPRAFDVVVCSHVLEHLANPIEALRLLKGLQAEAYVFAVPNVHRSARLIRALAGKTTPDHPAHLHGWGRPEFEAALGAAGFEVEGWYVDRVTISPFGGGFGTWLTGALEPLEVRLLPKLLPTLSSSLIARSHRIDDA